MRTLSIVIPVYNEEKFINTVIEKVVTTETPGFNKEIIIVDDGSSDNTSGKVKAQITQLKSSVRDVKFILIEKKKNEGKGAALKDGFRKATGDILMVQDADEEYSTKDYAVLIKPFLTNGTQVVYGSRNKKRENFHNRYSYFSYYVGGLALTWFVNLLYGTKISDQPTGYKLFSSDVRHLLLKPEENRFSYEVALTALLANNKIHFHEVPIHYKPRTILDGKKINFTDFVESVYVALKYKLAS